MLTATLSGQLSPNERKKKQVQLWSNFRSSTICWCITDCWSHCKKEKGKGQKGKFQVATNSEKKCRANINWVESKNLMEFLHPDKWFWITAAKEKRPQLPYQWLILLNEQNTKMSFKKVTLFVVFFSHWNCSLFKNAWGFTSWQTCGLSVACVLDAVTPQKIHCSTKIIRYSRGYY